jgi:proline iminopeptidase
MKTMYTILFLMFFVSCSGPLYKPGDLKNKQKYKHLLKATPSIDRQNYFVLNDNISLYYFTEGQGKAILIVHGGPGYPTEESWKGLEGLEKDYEFYYYHQRGCGKSTRPFDKFSSKNFYKNMKSLDENLGLPAQIADIEQIRRKLKQEKITLIGHSFGGFLASLYAIEFPEHVESLILVSPADVIKLPSPSGGLYDIVKRSLPKEYLPDYQKYIDELFNYHHLFDKSENQLVDESKAFIKFYNLAIKNNNDTSNYQIGGWVQQACFLSMGKKHDYSKYLKQIKAPTLIIQGENDIIPVSSCSLYLDNIPNASLKVIPGSTHFPFKEQPGKFEKIVADFFNTLKK